MSLINCAGSPSSSKNYALMMTSTTLVAYPGEAIIPPPAFTVFQLSASLTPYSDFADSMTLAAYSDEDCKKAAPGTLTSPVSPVPLTAGVATFDENSFSWSSSSTSSWAEGSIYLKGSLIASGTAYCSPGITIIQHFNLGYGYIHSGTTGAAGANTDATVYDSGRSIKIDSDGKYIIAGISKNTAGGQEASLWRYFPNGSIDTTFASNGIRHYGTTGVAGATGASTKDTVAELQIDSNGKYVLAGSSVNTAGGTEVALWRYYTNGNLDSAFGTNGVVRSGTPGAAGPTGAGAILDTAKSMKIDSSGQIVIAGTSKNLSNGTELLLRRYLATGAIDTAFASSGLYHSGPTGVAGATGANVSDIGNSLQMDQQGRYIVAGSSVNSDGKQEMALWRFNSNGALDTTWGTQGAIHSGVTGVAGGTGATLQDIGQKLLVDKKNRYVVVGSSMNSGGGTELALWRYLDTGTLDTSFNTTGTFHSGTTGVAGAGAAQTSDMGLTIAEDANSNYIISGTSLNSSLGKELAIWRITESGSLDSGFNSSGSLNFGSTGVAGATGSSVSDIPYSVQVDKVGTYIVVGESKNTSAGVNGRELTIWRYLNIGQLAR